MNVNPSHTDTHIHAQTHADTQHVPREHAARVVPEERVELLLRRQRHEVAADEALAAQLLRVGEDADAAAHRLRGGLVVACTATHTITKSTKRGYTAMLAAQQRR